MDLQTAVGVSMLALSRIRASAVFKELRQRDPHVSLEQLLRTLGIPADTQPALADAARSAAAAALVSAAGAGMAPIAWFDPGYPALLNCVGDPPPVLWARGRGAVLARPAVAIVGSRAATRYALDVGARLAGELAQRGIVVVSGLARGVDSAAHRGCLEAGGPTVAVLGSGVDTVYPPEHESLAETIASNGVVVSELGPGAAPLPEHFPLRNRIISGISLAVVVVEASEKSGSLITARCAMEQGRDVMAVPGSVLTGRNRGSHGLLKDGAKVVETADDILEELAWPGSAGAVPAPSEERVNRVAGPALSEERVNRVAGPALSEERFSRVEGDPLLARIEAGEVYRLDELVEATGVAASKLLPRLMELELQGYIVSVGGGRFARRRDESGIEHRAAARR
jgi:DNA processing protein